MCEWDFALGAKSLLASLFHRAHVAGASDLYSRIGIQTASVRDEEPDAWSTIMNGGSPLLEIHGGATAGCPGTFDISSYTNGKMRVRFGVGTKMTSAGAPASADVGAILHVGSCGRMIATWSGQVLATSTTPIFIPIGGFVSGLLAEVLKGTIALTAIGTNVQVRLAYRLAPLFQRVPGSWNAIGPTYDGTTTEGCTNELTPTVSTNMWLQPGISVSLSTGSTPAAAYVEVLLGAYRS